MSLSSNGGPGGGPGGNRKPEEGDYLIDWHNQYCAQLAFQTEAFLRNIIGQIRAELTKMRTDVTFIETKLPGPHRNIDRLKPTDRDLRRALDPLNELADQFRAIGSRAAKRA